MDLIFDLLRICFYTILGIGIAYLCILFLLLLVDYLMKRHTKRKYELEKKKGRKDKSHDVSR